MNIFKSFASILLALFGCYEILLFSFYFATLNIRNLPVSLYYFALFIPSTYFIYILIINILFIILFIEIFILKKYLKNPLAFKNNNIILKLLLFSGFIFSLLNFVIMDLYLVFLMISNLIEPYISTT